MESGFVTNAGLRLHYLAVGDREPPLLLVPGLSDAADDYAEILDALAPDRAVAMSLRGQGRSDRPDKGYDLEHHVSDIATVVDGLDLTAAAIFAHSRAVPYAIAYAAAHEDRVGCLVLGDNGAIHRAFPPRWVDDFAASTWRGQRVSERIERDVLVGIQREAREVELWGTLASLSIPCWALLAGTHPADVLDRATERYRAAGAEVVVFDDADHALWEPDLDRFVELLRRAVAHTRRR